MIKISGFSDEISQDTTEQFEALNRLGISYFEPRGIDGKNISALTRDEALALKKKMDTYGIKASSIGSPIGKIKTSDDFDAHFEVFKNVVEIAGILDTPYVRMFSFYPVGEWDEMQKNIVFERLQKLIGYAKKNSVILLHENEKGIYGDIGTRCKELMETFYGNNFKAVFDPANFIQSGEDTKICFEMLKDYIEYMHIKDALKDNGKVVPSGYGDGNVEYVALLSTSAAGGVPSADAVVRGAFEALKAKKEAGA